MAEVEQEEDLHLMIVVLMEVMEELMVVEVELVVLFGLIIMLHLILKEEVVVEPVEHMVEAVVEDGDKGPAELMVVLEDINGVLEAQMVQIQ